MNIALTALGLLEFAPILGKWFSSPHQESVYEKVVQTAKKITQQENLEKITEIFQTNPDKSLEFEQKIKEMETEIDLMLLHDRQQARKREQELIQQGYKSFRSDIMVFSAVLGLGFCLASLGFYSEKLSGEAIGIISTIAGIFGACLKDAYAFEFGSSRGSKTKDQTMAAMMEQI